MPQSLVEQRKRQAILVRGVVQGVGFRPFVYRLALEHRLAGFIGNDTNGVTIEVEGFEEQVSAFVAGLRSEASSFSWNALPAGAKAKTPPDSA